jgi:hypothetical protein
MNNDTLILPESQHPIVTNWKEIDLSTPEGLRALDRYIAPLVGWTCKLEGKLGYYLRSPAGSVYQITPVTWCDTPEETIAHVWRNGYIPKYTTDLNDAFKLANAQTHIRTRRGKQDEQIWGVQLNLQEETHQDTSLALAICKAWLSWYDWREDLYARVESEQDANGGQS